MALLNGLKDLKGLTGLIKRVLSEVFDDLNKQNKFIQLNAL